MRLVVLGAGTAIPEKGYSPAGIYVRIGREHILLDAGAGTLQRLLAVGIRYVDLDRVFLSHYHVDHCVDLISLLFAARIPDPPRSKPLTIYGPKGLRTLYRQLNNAFRGWLEPRSYRLQLQELADEQTLRLRGYAVTARFMNHSALALGYRLKGRGKSLAYSGDTDRCDAVVSLGKGVDLLILECSTTDERKVQGHLTPSECGRIAAEAGCRHLLLTHFYPIFRRYDIRARVRRTFLGPLSLARDGLEMTI